MGMCGSSKVVGVVQNSSKMNFGHRSGMVLSPQSFILEQSKGDDLPPIQILQIGEDEQPLVKVDDQLQFATALMKQSKVNMKVVKVLRYSKNTMTIEVCDKQLLSYIFKRSFFSSFDQASKHISYLYNFSKIGTKKIVQFQSLVIDEMSDEKSQQPVYVVDRLFTKSNCNLEDYLKLQTDYFKQMLNVLDLLEQVTECVSVMHSEGFAYRFLRPENILLKEQVGNEKQTWLLSNPSLQWNSKEIQLIKSFISYEKDFYLYDGVLIGVLVLYLLDQSDTFDELLLMRCDQTIWEVQVQKQRASVSEQFKGDVPQVLIQLLESLCGFNKDSVFSMKRIYNMICSTRQKAMQTAFRNDSLGAFLQYHGDRKLNNLGPWMYFAKQNQLHLYNLDTNKFHYLKVFKKKQRYLLQSSVVYHPDQDKYYFFNTNTSSYLLKVYDETHDKSMLSQRREVQLFRDFKSLQFEDVQLLMIRRSDDEQLLYILNNFKQNDEHTGSNYYGSYVIHFGYQHSDDESEEREQINEQDLQEAKMVVKIFEGPKNFQWRRQSFHFFDPHNHYIYCIPDYNNIFQNGIRYSYFDTISDKGNFKEGILRFACSSKEIFTQFCEVNMKIKKIIFVTEVQHGVFIMEASRNMFILDFNFKCFYSLASLVQLQKFISNRQNNIQRNQQVYETLNQPFELKYHSQLCYGRNFQFQNGYLHVIAIKEIETVHCVYEILPNQGQVALLSCVSLYSGQDLLTILPKQISKVIIQNQQMYNEVLQSKKVLKQVHQYRCVELMSYNPGEYFYVARNENKDRFYLHQFEAQSLNQLSQLFRCFQKKVSSDLLMNPLEYFATCEGLQFIMNYVNEEVAQTMDKEVESRRLSGKYFKPKELALLLKIIFKGLQDIHNQGMEHGNLNLSNLCVTKQGLIKLSGWYLTNRKGYQSDLIDALRLVYSLATLTTPSETEFSFIIVEDNKQKLSNYTGLDEFLITSLKQQNQKLQIALNQALSLSQKLMISEIEISSFNSSASAIFWVCYGSNYLIVTNLQNTQFIKVDVKGSNGASFKFSKYCMFTYDLGNMLYISGAIKEDLKFQTFYQLELNWQPTQQTQLRRLRDIPFGVISPTLVYGGNKVYSIGGYEVMSNLSKVITNKVFSFSIKNKTWKMCQNLPIGLVQSTGLFNQQQNRIYLLGGVSSEIDLSMPKLIFFVYDLDHEQWDFTVDLSFNSPYQNSRFFKPMIKLIDHHYFIAYVKEENKYCISIFELLKGGVIVKLEILDPTYSKTKEKQRTENNDRDYFIDEQTDVVQRALQDDLSMAVYHGTLYVMDDKTKHLHMFKLTDLQKPDFSSIPCFIMNSEFQSQLKSLKSIPEDDRSPRSFQQ